MIDEYVAVRSGQGPSVHLAVAGRQTTLCGRSVTHLETTVPFEPSGCARCGEAASAVETHDGARSLGEV